MLEKNVDGPKQNLSPLKDLEGTIPEPLSTEETVNIVSEAYQIAGPRIGSTLVEANVVLTLSGARGHTEFFIDNPTPADSEGISKLSKFFLEKGIFTDAIGPFMSAKGMVLMVGMVSFRGIERVSKLTKIPGFIPFQASLGWNGYVDWGNKCLANLEALQAEKQTPLSADDLQTMTVGVEKGYPDIAIYDFIDWLAADMKTPLADSEIPYVDLYGGAEPNFSFDSQHKSDPGIRRTIVTWSKILREFYHSDWHKMISQDPQFVQARAATQP